MASAADAAPSFLYLPHLDGSPETFTLGEEDARYVARVVRAKPGERLTASDGAGCVAELVIETVRPDVFVRIAHRARAAEGPPRVLLCGAPEGERGDWMVEKCAELGVTRFVPVHTERVRWPEGTRVERWSRLAVAALRQSQAARLMGVESPVSLRDAVGSLGSGVRWLADVSGTTALEPGSPSDAAIAGAVGPSSGFSVEELKYLADNGFLPVGLASSRLRTETAAVALAAIWAAQGIHARPRA
jgi:16S rRNA (uracil1498-N3)-methyltransferase